jgi:hypothetical protein
VIPVDSAYRTPTAACAPFRAGGRLSAFPEVRFEVAEGQIGLPGQLLPGPVEGRVQARAARDQSSAFS